MRKPGGYLIVNDPSLRAKEADTFTCGHCVRIVRVKPKADAADFGGLCKCCMKLICSRCVNIGTCYPIEKAIEDHEKQEQGRRHLRRMMGIG